MAWNVHAEFEIVDLLLDSNSRSKGVDAFALSLLKVERQARRILTFLAYQCPTFTENEIPELRRILVRHSKFYFTGSLCGIDLISPKPLSEICGSSHTILLQSLRLIHTRRGKIFHGQLTDEGLSTSDLADMVEILKRWSVSLAEKASTELGYDGFSCHSFFKHPKPNFHQSLRRQLTTIVDYGNLIDEAAQEGKRLLKPDQAQ